jgi:hypothetical protein
VDWHADSYRCANDNDVLGHVYQVWTLVIQQNTWAASLRRAGRIEDLGEFPTAKEAMEAVEAAMSQ